MNNLAFLQMWIRVVVIIAAICTTALPFIYSLSPWRTTVIGKLFMMKAISFAVAIDLNVLFFVWRPQSVILRFWIYTIALTAIAASTAAMAIYIWRTNRIREKVFWVLLSDKMYRFIKRVVQVALPGLGTLYFTLAQIWNLEYGEQVVGTISAFTLFLGIVLGLSSTTYYNTDAKFDGVLMIEDTEDGSNLRLKSLDMDALDTKKAITFKIVNPNARLPEIK